MRDRTTAVLWFQKKLEVLYQDDDQIKTNTALANFLGKTKGAISNWYLEKTVSKSDIPQAYKRLGEVAIVPNKDLADICDAFWLDRALFVGRPLGAPLKEGESEKEHLARFVRDLRALRLKSGDWLHRVRLAENAKNELIAQRTTTIAVHLFLDDYDADVVKSLGRLLDIHEGPVAHPAPSVPLPRGPIEEGVQPAFRGSEMVQYEVYGPPNWHVMLVGHDPTDQWVVYKTSVGELSASGAYKWPRGKGIQLDPKVTGLHRMVAVLTQNPLGPEMLKEFFDPTTCLEALNKLPRHLELRGKELGLKIVRYYVA